MFMPPGKMDPKEMMKAINDNPMMKSMMQSMFSNPDNLKQMLQNNPLYKKMMEKDPRMAEALNDPQTLK